MFLLGISARFPVKVHMSTREMVVPELTSPTGWGAVLYDKNDAHLFREPEPISNDGVSESQIPWSIQSRLILSNVGSQNRSPMGLRNTPPFTREIHGRLHSFNFNGAVPGVFELELVTDRYWPLGDTQGEYAFCWVLEHLANKDRQTTWTDTASILQLLGQQLAELGPLSFMYSDSQCLYAFASNTRNGEGEGLYYLDPACRQNTTIKPFRGLSIHPDTSDADQELCLIASTPLNNSDWIPFEPEQLLVLEKGEQLQ